MYLNSFITKDQNAKVTGIKVGEWFVSAPHRTPCLVFKCHEVIGLDVIKSEEENGQQRGFSTASCYVLDSDYTEEQLLCLQQRARKEYEEYLRIHQFGYGKPMGTFKETSNG